VEKVALYSDENRTINTKMLFSVDNPTLNRFYSAHYLLPFLLAGLVILHLAALHQYGSTNPLGVPSQVDQITFHPYYTSKDTLGVVCLGIFAAILVFFYPDLLSHPDNNIPANPYATPAHIVPEYRNSSLVYGIVT
jgi:quinol-cytochrome oxidoreductase complex cytochrome b subunit